MGAKAIVYRPYRRNHFVLFARGRISGGGLVCQDLPGQVDTRWSVRRPGEQLVKVQEARCHLAGILLGDVAEGLVVSPNKLLKSFV